MSDFQPFDILPGGESKALVLLADHASRNLPARYGDLGLPAAAFARHIAYDIGVEGVTRLLAARLGVPAVLGGFSRLLIDPNRGEDDPTLIMKISDGAIVPANHPMSVEEWTLSYDFPWLLCDKGAAARHPKYAGKRRGTDREWVGRSGPRGSVIAPVFSHDLNG